MSASSNPSPNMLAGHVPTRIFARLWSCSAMAGLADVLLGADICYRQ